jgi:hypothetical protein
MAMPQMIVWTTTIAIAVTTTWKAVMTQVVTTAPDDAFAPVYRWSGKGT